MTSIWLLTSRLEVGSSRIRTSGSWASPRAMSTLWSCPELTSSTSLPARSWSPIILSTPSTTSRSWSELDHWAWGNLPMRTNSATDVRNVPDAWLGTKATLRARSMSLIEPTSSPSSSTVPADGLRILSMHLARVVLPAPLGPRMHTSSGLSRTKLTSSSTRLLP